MEKTFEDMLSHSHARDSWTTCTLCRSSAQSRNLLNRAKERQVGWPTPKQFNNSHNPIDDPAVYTNIDDAFAGMIQFMSLTSRQCKRYYRSCGSQSAGVRDVHHCARFHTPKYIKANRKNPLQTTEDIHLRVHPGNYAVTAGEWGTTQQQTHVVRVNQGQTVNLDFVM